MDDQNLQQNVNDVLNQILGPEPTQPAPAAPVAAPVAPAAPAFPEPPTTVTTPAPTVSPMTPPIAAAPAAPPSAPMASATPSQYEGQGMGKYKVVVIPEKCIGAASCVAVAAKAFQLNDQQIAEVLPTVNQETDENLLLAAQSCPTLAIEVYDTTTGEKVWPK